MQDTIHYDTGIQAQPSLWHSVATEVKTVSEVTAEMFKALMPVTSSSSPTHNIYIQNNYLRCCFSQDETTVNTHNAHYGFNIASIVLYSY